MTEPILLDAILLLTELTERLLTEPRTKALQAEARTTLKTLEALNLLPPTEEEAEETETSGETPETANAAPPEPFPEKAKAIPSAA